MDSIKINIHHLKALNHHLAEELSKLPEIKRKRSSASSRTLNNLVKIYRFAPNRFDDLFRCMDTFGLPEFRSYCSLLQAFFWIVQDGKMSQAGSLLGLNLDQDRDDNGECFPILRSLSSDFKNKNRAMGSCPDNLLNDILNAAWPGEYRSMLTLTIHEIIQKITCSDKAEEYAILVLHHTPLQLQGYIIEDFLKKREIFDTTDWETIETAIENARWKSFFRVADRLNAPEFINYYMNKYFLFRKIPANGVYFTFLGNKAQCTDAAYFTQFMLKRSGYNTFIRSVKWDKDPWDGLHTGAGIVLANGEYLLVSNFTGINSISGPFSDTHSLDRKMSCGRRIIDSRWGAYYPPRYY